MPELPKIGADVELRLTDWNRNADKMIADAGRIDRMLDTVVASANRAEAALNSITGNIRLDVDSSRLDSIARIADGLDRNATIDVNVSGEEAITDIASLITTAEGDAIDIKVNVADESLHGVANTISNIDDVVLTPDIDFTGDSVSAAQTDLAALDMIITPDIQFTGDSISGTKTDLDALDTTATVDVDADTSDAESSITNLRETATATVLIPIAIAGGAVAGAGVLAAPILEMDTAVQRLAGTTGEKIPRAAELIEELYVGAWG